MSDAKTISAAIKANRAESNAAIKAHDDFKVSALFDRDAVVITGGGTAIATRKALRATFVQQFRQPDLVYMRTPKTIEVSEDLSEAAENGTWVGSWSVGDKKVEASGTYMALWHPVADKWLIKGEMFATLKESVK